MNKSILKHEIRSMKWMLLLSILASLFLTIMFNSQLDREYISMFYNGIYGNRAFILESFRDLTITILITFIAISIVQIFMQFRSEKEQETRRFLKALPVGKEEFFKIKLTIGLINISLAFLVLVIGILIVRSSNMFWIKDVHSISHMPKVFIKADSALSLLKELGLIYLVTLSFYSFLFMVQYTFANVIGAIVTGILVWMAPIFIVLGSMYTLETLNIVDIYKTGLAGHVDNLSQWLLPWMYVLDHAYNVFSNGMNGLKLGSININLDLAIKYIISFVLIIINIMLAHKFNKNSRVEDENKIIVFKSTRKIFKLGVTICGGLLVSFIINEILMLQMPNILNIILILLGGFIGYLVSRKITQVGNV